MDKQNKVVLKSKISPIILRIPQIDDAKELFNILTDIRNTEYDPHINKGLTIDNIKSMIIRMSTSTTLDNPNSFNFVIINTSINNLIGLSGFGHIDIDNKIGDVGVIIDFEFNNLKLNEVTATMLEKNIPMRNLLDKKLKKELF
jgi:RimJ/RimL family protein N-acetyltransferase